MKPLIKWVGGKQKLAPTIADLMPAEFTEYHEPFCGGAALFCELWNTGYLEQCEVITLGDANPHLMGLYETVKHPRGVQKFKAAMSIYRDHYASRTPEEREAMFYDSRRIWNESPEKGRDPGRFVFLKQTAFNGLWRENSKGELNSSWGKYKVASLPDDDLIDEWHAALQRVTLRTGSFQSLDPWEGALVYLDPPYLGTFDGYLAGGFDHAAHTELLCKMAEWRMRGATTVYSNAPDVGPLISLTWPDATVHMLETTYSVNSKGSGRNPVPELLAL